MAGLFSRWRLVAGRKLLKMLPDENGGGIARDFFGALALVVVGILRGGDIVVEDFVEVVLKVVLIIRRVTAYDLARHVAVGVVSVRLSAECRHRVRMCAACIVAVGLDYLSKSKKMRTRQIKSPKL